MVKRRKSGSKKRQNKKHLVHHKLPEGLDKMLAIFATVIGIWFLAYLVFGTVSTVGKAAETAMLVQTYTWQWNEDADAFGKSIDADQRLKDQFFPTAWSLETCNVGSRAPPETAFWPIPAKCFEEDAAGEFGLKLCSYTACMAAAEEWDRTAINGVGDNALITDCWQKSCNCC